MVEAEGPLGEVETVLESLVEVVTAPVTEAAAVARGAADWATAGLAGVAAVAEPRVVGMEATGRGWETAASVEAMECRVCATVDPGVEVATGVVFHEAAEAAATATAAAAAATEAEEADARPPAPAAPLVAGWFPVGRVAWAVVIRRR